MNEICVLLFVEEIKFSMEDLQAHLSMKQEVTYVDAVNLDSEVHAPSS